MIFDIVGFKHQHQRKVLFVASVNIIRVEVTTVFAALWRHVWVVLWQLMWGFTVPNLITCWTQDCEVHFKESFINSSYLWKPIFVSLRLCVCVRTRKVLQAGLQLHSCSVRGQHTCFSKPYFKPFNDNTKICRFIYRRHHDMETESASHFKGGRTVQRSDCRGTCLPTAACSGDQNQWDTVSQVQGF